MVLFTHNFKKIKGVAHKSDDVDRTHKTHLIACSKWIKIFEGNTCHTEIRFDLLEFVRIIGVGNDKKSSDVIIFSQ